VLQLPENVLSDSRLEELFYHLRECLVPVLFAPRQRQDTGVDRAPKSYSEVSLLECINNKFWQEECWLTLCVSVCRDNMMIDL
jgi:hypothetical protein